MIAISRLSKNDKPVSLERVAKSTQVSRRYLEQLAIGLKKASLLRGVSGRSGGYLLACPAKDISIGQVFAATIGPINIVDCVLHPEKCLKSDICECRMLYSFINRRIDQVLNEVTLADIAEGNWQDRFEVEVAEHSHDSNARELCPIGLQ